MKLNVNILLGRQYWAVGQEIPDELVPPHLAAKYRSEAANEEVVSGANGGEAKPVSKPKKVWEPPSAGQLYVRRGTGFVRIGRTEPELGEKKYKHVVGRGYQPVGRVSEEELAC